MIEFSERERRIILELLSFSCIGKKNKTRAVQAESSKFELLLIDQGFQIVIRPRNKKLCKKRHLTELRMLFFIRILFKNENLRAEI